MRVYIIYIYRKVSSSDLPLRWVGHCSGASALFRGLGEGVARHYMSDHFGV